MLTDTQTYQFHKKIAAICFERNLFVRIVDVLVGARLNLYTNVSLSMCTPESYNEARWYKLSSLDGINSPFVITRRLRLKATKQTKKIDK